MNGPKNEGWCVFKDRRTVADVNVIEYKSNSVAGREGNGINELRAKFGWRGFRFQLFVFTPIFENCDCSKIGSDAQEKNHSCALLL